MEFTKTRSLAAGEKLFHEKSASAEVYYLRVGTLLILKGEILIGQVKPPAYVGELGPVLNMPRSTTVIAKTAASLDVYDGRELMAKLTLQSDMGIKFLRSLGDRFEMLRDRVNEYQYQVLDECLKIMSVHLSEKKIAEKRMGFADIKLVRREIEVALQQVMSRKDVVEDHAALYRMAKQHGVKDKFEAGVATRFRTWAPMDMKPYKIPRIETFSDFRTAAQNIAQKIVELTAVLAEYQKLGLSHLESEVIVMEETLPFKAREQILKELMLATYAKGSLDDFRRSVTEFDRAIKSLAEESGKSDMPLGSVAKKFSLEQPYMQALQAKWKEFLMK